MEKNNSFEFETSLTQQPSKKYNIEYLKRLVKSQYEAIKVFLDEKITEKNINIVERLMLSTEDVIENCMSDKDYAGNRDENFINLNFLFHKLSLRIETYKLEEKIEQLDRKSKQIDDKQKEIEEKNNNLVYNLLGFLTAFSIVSAVVAVIPKIKGTLNIMLFMSFTLLILLTTLIGLHNFYIGNNSKEKKLQNNYFLWRMVLIITVGLLIAIGGKYVYKHKDKLFKQESKVENIISNTVKNGN